MPEIANWPLNSPLLISIFYDLFVFLLSCLLCPFHSHIYSNFVSYFVLPSLSLFSLSLSPPPLFVCEIAIRKLNVDGISA